MINSLLSINERIITYMFAMKNIFLYLAVVFLILSCSSTQKAKNRAVPVSLSSQQDTSTGNSLTVGPGDEISVYIWRHDELQRNTKIDLAGNIYLPLVGEVHAGNLNINELQQKLSQAYGKYIVKPQVDVSPVNITSKKFTVLGEIKSPGNYTIGSDVTLIDALAQAGGKTTNANSVILLIRRMQDQVRVFMTDTDISYLSDDSLSEQEIEEGIKLASTRIQPGDIMYVPQSTIANIEAFMQRITNITAPIFGVQRGVIFWPDTIDALEGNSTNAIITN
ncbi:hypothetical protein KKHLCK_05705 [Candidatus Electrothrix laxa]